VFIFTSQLGCLMCTLTDPKERSLKGVIRTRPKKDKTDGAKPVRRTNKAKAIDRTLSISISLPSGSLRPWKRHLSANWGVQRKAKKRAQEGLPEKEQRGEKSTSLITPLFSSKQTKRIVSRLSYLQLFGKKAKKKRAEKRIATSSKSVQKEKGQTVQKMGVCPKTTSQRR